LSLYESGIQGKKIPWFFPHTPGRPDEENPAIMSNTVGVVEDTECRGGAKTNSWPTEKKKKKRAPGGGETGTKKCSHKTRTQTINTPQNTLHIEAKTKRQGHLRKGRE